jgi:SAM-dependent methyltransferase
MSLPSGARVLDLCCGAGASALPAAAAVGPEGEVLGIDLAEPLLELGRSRAVTLGLGNATFRPGDATRTGLEDASVDACICVFGVFFAADMAGFVREMWRVLRPGGTLAITTWGPRWCEPASTLFWESVRDLEPALFRAFNPWDEITTAPALAALLARGGVTVAKIESTEGETHQLATPGAFWDVVLGSGYRATVDSLAVNQRAELRRRVVAELSAKGVTRLCNDVVFATATKP